jgi:hypothetical protein
MDNFVCKYCNKSFSNKQNLTAHIKKTKRCIKLREEETNIVRYECVKCFKNYTCNRNLKKHIEKCEGNFDKKIENYENKIEELENAIITLHKNQLNELKEQNRDLQNNLNKLADKAVSKSTTSIINNNKDNKIVNQYNHVQSLDLSKEHLEKVINENMRFKHVCKGRKGFVDLVSNNILKDENGQSLAWCPDYTRKMVKYKDIDGDIVTDPKAYNIITSVAPLVEKKIREVKQLFEKTYYTTDEKGNRRNKKDEELSEDEEEFVEEYTETESEYSDGGRRWVSLKKVKRRIFSNINKIWNDIKDYKSKYNIDKVNFYFDTIIHSIDNIIEVCENFDKVSHELSVTLPNKPPKKAISIEE